MEFPWQGSKGGAECADGASSKLVASKVISKVMSNKKLVKIRVVGKSVKVMAAALVDQEGNVHSVMMSNNSMWSAAQRVRANKKLTARRVEVQISVPLMEKLVDSLGWFYQKPKKVVKENSDEYGIE